MASLEFGRNWTDDEITKLCYYVGENGTGNWKAVSAFIGSRSPASCRQRWFDFHDSGVRTDKFTHEEMLTALLLRSKCGKNRWSKITKSLPGRTSNQVKNFYNKAKKATDFPVTLIRNLVEKIEGEGKSMESCLLPIAYEELIRLQTEPPPATAGGASSSTAIAADSDLLMPPEITSMIIIPNFTDPPAEIPHALPHLQPQDGGFDLIPPAEVPEFGGAGAAYSSFDDMLTAEIPDISFDSGFSDFADPLEIPQDDLNDFFHDHVFGDHI